MDIIVTGTFSETDDKISPRDKIDVPVGPRTYSSTFPSRLKIRLIVVYSAVRTGPFSRFGKLY